MSDIVLLTALDDADKVTPIIDAMVEDRLDARWFPVGDADSAAATRDAIAAARCVLIAWSRATAAGDAAVFQGLAGQAIGQRKGVGVLIDRVAPPAALDSTTLYDLSGWRGTPTRWRRWLGGGLYMRDVLAAARYKVAGRDPAPPSAPRAMLFRHALATIPAAFALIALVPTLFGFWRDLDLPGAAEAKAWQATNPTDCAAIRTFLARYPDGKLAGQAQARLDGRSVTSQTRWKPEERNMPLYVGSGLAAPMPDTTRAQADLDIRIAAQATNICRGLAEAGHARFVRYRLLPGDRACISAGDGARCTFDGQITCVQEEPLAIDAERCLAPAAL